MTMMPYLRLRIAAAAVCCAMLAADATIVMTRDESTAHQVATLAFGVLCIVAIAMVAAVAWRLWRARHASTVIPLVMYEPLVQRIEDGFRLTLISDDNAVTMRVTLTDDQAHELASRLHEGLYS